MNDIVKETEATMAIASLALPGAVDLFFTQQQVTGMTGSQTSSKWGSESGPNAFRVAYAQVLTDLHTDVSALQRELSDYVSTVFKVINSLDDADTEAARQQDAILAQQVKDAENASQQQGQKNQSTTTPQNPGDR